MLEIIIAALIFAYLAKREKKKTTGSVTLMTLVVLGIGFGGYFATIFLFAEQLVGVSDILISLTLYAWGALGFGVYWFISKKREESYRNALDLD